MRASEGEFQRLLQRVRDGSEEASAELVRRYEPGVRRAARFQLTDARLRRVVDSLDVAQSVLGSFFAHARRGGFRLDTSAQLVAVLAAMARNCVCDHARHERRRHSEEGGPARREPVEALLGHEPAPGDALEGRDLLEALLHRLPAEGRHLAEQRALGRRWADLAGDLDIPAEALRKRLSRALAQLRAEVEDSDG